MQNLLSCVCLFFYEEFEAYQNQGKTAFGERDKELQVKVALWGHRQLKIAFSEPKLEVTHKPFHTNIFTHNGTLALP